MGKPTYASEIVTPRQRNLSFYLVLLVAVMPLWSIVPLSWLFVVYSLRTGIIWSFGWRGKAWFIAALCEVGAHLCRCLSMPKRYPSFQKSRNILIPIQQVAFSVHYYRLAKHASGPSPLSQNNTVQLQAAFKRVLNSGLVNQSEDIFDNEDEDKPGTPAAGVIEQLQFNDPRAIDFRNYLRTWSVHLTSLFHLPSLNLFTCIGLDGRRGPPFACKKFTLGYTGHATMHFSHPSNPFRLPTAKSLIRL
jgi:hypothetical protein